MPLNYSKWDNIEISDDEDIAVHPNVDKKSFIKWNQEAIHQRRAERRSKIKLLRDRIEINKQVIKKVSEILHILEAADVSGFAKLFGELENAALEARANSSSLDDLADSGTHSLERMLVNLFNQIQNDISKEGLDLNKEVVILKLKEELKKVETHHKDCKDQLAAEEKIENSTLTSDSICKPGFDKTIISKDAKPVGTSKEKKKTTKKEKKIEVLNPRTKENVLVERSAMPNLSQTPDAEEDEDIGISEIGLEFAKLKNFDKCFEFISKHPYIIDDRYNDELLAHAFEVELKGDSNFARHCVRQSLIIQYCLRMGKDGISLFFNRTKETGLQFFEKDVEDTYVLLKERCKVIAEKSQKESVEKSVIQLEPFSGDSQITIDIPKPEETERWELLQSLPEAFRAALEDGRLEIINKALAEMSESTAEQALHVCDMGNFLLFEVPTENPEVAATPSTFEESEIIN